MERLSLKELKKLSSSEVDQLLNLKPALEVSTSDREAYGDGLTGVNALYTSYQDFLLIYEDLQKRKAKSFVDLGAGNCRSKILFDYLEAPFKSTAIEFAEERVESAKECYKSLGLSRFPEGIIQQDLRESNLGPYEAFFLYLPVGPTIDSIIEKLKTISVKEERILYVIESHGDLISYLQDHLTSLELLEKRTLHSKRHDPNLYIFRLKSCEDQLAREKELKEKAQKLIKTEGGFLTEGLMDWEKWFVFSLFKEDPFLQFLVNEESFKWLASLESWQYGVVRGTLETAYPYRIHKLSQIEGVILPTNTWLKLVKERRDTFKPPLNAIRKIIVSPTAQVEYAGGSKEEISEQTFKENFPKFF